MMRARYLLLSLAALGVVVLAGRPALATTSYSDIPGTTVDFTGISETANSAGDSEPLYGAPTGSGDQLIFGSLTFGAHSSGGGIDDTAGLLNVTFTAHDGFTIDQIVINEAGSSDITASSAGTGTFASMAGSFTVVAGTTTTGSTPFTGTVSPDYITATGTTPWTGQVVLDLSAYGATQVTLAFDNDVQAFSEDGTEATITKSAFNITVIPEPGTLALLGGGLLALALRARGRRA
jgi:hypothetical protein